MATTMIDQIPTKFVLKVYETKALAEVGDELNALYVFNNGRDGDTPDALIANGGQFIYGRTDSTTAANRLNDNQGRFGSRLIGKTVKNTTDTTEAIITGVDTMPSSSDFPQQLILDGSIMGTSKNYYIVDPGAFFTFQKYYYRFESTDPVTGFVVDWDDGEDNSPEKANRQIIKLDSPSFYAVTSHTYTTHGVHYPMIRTINTDGFYSKWYVAFKAQAAGISSIEPQTLPAGQNDFSNLSLDSQAIPRIPEISPANVPPIGVLKVDRNKVYSGIDNSIFENITSPIAYCFVERESGTELTGFDDGLEVVWEDNTGNIQKDLLAAHSDISDLAAKHTIGTVGSIYVRRILSVKLVLLKEGNAAATLAADERVKIYAMATAAVAGNCNVTSDPIVTMVSLGNPYVSLDRPGFYVTLDGSQSQTRCSNVSIDKYIFDTGKLDGATAAGDAGIFEGPGMAEQVSDILGAAVGATNTYTQSDSSLRAYYTLAPNASALSSGSGNVIDSTTKRIFDEERLIKLQVIDTSSTTRQESTRYFSSGSPSGSVLADDLDASQSTIAVDDGTNFAVGDVIASSGTPSDSVEQMYVFLITGNTLSLVRQYNGASTTMNDTDVVYTLNDNGQLGDTCDHSFVEHWNPTGYADQLVRPSSLKSRALLMYATTTPDIGVGATIWRTVLSDYALHTRATGEGTSNTGEPGLIFGGRTDADIGESNGTELSAESTTGAEMHSAQNYLLMCKDEKFNKIHLRMKNSFTSQAASVPYAPDAVECTSAIALSPAREKTKLFLWYTARTSPSESTYRWKPIAFSDGTFCRTYDDGDTENNALRASGSIIFDMPNDWVKVKSENLTWENSAQPLSDEDGEGGTDDPAANWTEEMYGLLLGISAHANATLVKYKCVSVQSYNNSHSQVITIVDPHHKSLNDIAIAQSISYSRRGKYITVSDRIGRTELRKIGAEGGTMTFGGVELAGTYSTQKKLLNIYQREGTPVYLDIQRGNSTGEYIRFFGVITSLSEDYPTGKQTPKFGIKMQVTHVCEYDSNGAWIGGGLMSLGGERIDVTSFAP